MMENRVGNYIIHLRPVLGRGAFGEVFKATSLLTEEVVAAKRINVPKNNWRETILQNTKREIDVLKSVQGHPNILRVFDTYQMIKDNEFWIISELCELEDLSQYVKIYDLNISNKLEIMHEVTQGLYFLHGKEIIHRDVKPQNTLLTAVGGMHVVKLCDFGLSRVLPTLTGHEPLTGKVGTRDYKAPELLDDNRNYDTTVDGFAAGVMFHELMEDKLHTEYDMTDEPIGFTIHRTGKDYVIETDEGADDVIKRINAVINSMIRRIKRFRKPIQEVVSEIQNIQKEVPKPTIPPKKPHRSGESSTDCPSQLANDLPDSKASLSVRLKHPLPFLTNSLTAFSNDGIILEQSMDKKVVKMKLLKHPTLAYMKEVKGKKVLPEEKFIKYVLDNGQVLMKDERTLFVLSSDFQQIRSFDGDMDYGHLCGVLFGDKMLYSKISGDVYKLSLYTAKDHDHVCTLTQAVSSKYISACSKADWIAIVDQMENTLDIYKELGIHTRIKLDFAPWGRNSICAVKDFLVIAEYCPGRLHVFNWEGQELSQLELGGAIFGVGGGREELIQVHVTENQFDYLYVCKID